MGVHLAQVTLICMLSLMAALAFAAADDPVITAGQDELLAAMLGKGATLPDHCELKDGQVERTTVKAIYACPGGEVVFQLTHPSNAPATAARTERFAIALVSGSPPAALAPALESLIRAKEGAFEWKSLQPPAEGRSPKRITLGAAGLLAALVLGWLLWRRRSARATDQR